MPNVMDKDCLAVRISRECSQVHGRVKGRCAWLSAYDAAYLELGLRRRLRLSTLDKALQKAAEAEKVFFAME